LLSQCTLLFKHTSATETYTLSLHDALPISPVLEARGRSCYLPGGVRTDRGRLGEEVECLLARGDALAAATPLVEQFPAALGEGVVQLRDEREGGGREDLVEPVGSLAGDGQPVVEPVSHDRTPLGRTLRTRSGWRRRGAGRPDRT